MMVWHHALKHKTNKMDMHLASPKWVCPLFGHPNTNNFWGMNLDTSASRPSLRRHSRRYPAGCRRRWEVAEALRGTECAPGVAKGETGTSKGNHQETRTKGSQTPAGQPQRNLRLKPPYYEVKVPGTTFNALAQRCRQGAYAPNPQYLQCLRSVKNFSLHLRKPRSNWWKSTPGHSHSFPSCVDQKKETNRNCTTLYHANQTTPPIQPIQLRSNNNPTAIQPRSNRDPTPIRPRSNHDPAAIQPRSKPDPTAIHPRSNRDPTAIRPRSNRDPTEMQPRSNPDPTPIQPRSNPHPTEIQPRSSRDPTEIQPRSNQDPTEIQPRSNRDQTEIQPRSNRDPTEIQPSREPTDPMREGEPCIATHFPSQLRHPQGAAASNGGSWNL